MEEEELPPVLDDTELFASAHETRAATIAELEADEPKPLLADDDFDDEEEKVRYKKVFVGAPMWVVTFGDLMSLLLTFFVLILSFSTMDPVKFKVVRGSLDTALGIQKDLGEEHAARDNMIATEFSRRDFNKQIESILKKALRDTFPPGQEPGRVEKVNDIRGEVVRFIAYDLFLPGSEAAAPKAKTVYQVMADTLVNMNARMEVRGIALERFAQDLRQRGQARLRRRDPCSRRRSTGGHREPRRSEPAPARSAAEPSYPVSHPGSRRANRPASST